MQAGDAEQVVELVLESGAQTSKLPSFQFPDQALTSVAAFSALFELWGLVDYQPETSPIACDFAKNKGLGCLERQGSRQSLVFLDRPAMLQLQDEAGNRGYVVLRSLEDDVAEVVLPSGTQRISFASVEPFWFGDYRVLWQRPDYLSRKHSTGSGAAQELWIGARMMELAEAYGESEAQSARIKRLPANEQVRWYQALRGLTVDGIAGAMTILQINNDLNAEVPRLTGSVQEGEE